MTDILDDLKKRLADIGFANPQVEKVVMDVRREWAGDTVYISYEYTQKNLERNRNIIRDYKAGESVSLLSRRYKLSRQRISKIVKW